MTFLLFLLITFALLSSRDPAKVSAEGMTTYYIDAVNGDDENTGTSADAAWQTAAKIGSMDFKPGDSILFAGGQIHTIYTLAFDRNDRGTMIAPITISSYGEGSATLSSGNLTGIYPGGTAGCSISNLKLIGSGRDTNNGDGISLWNGSENIIFQGNCCYSTGDDFVVNWGRKIYHSLEEMRLDGLEMMDNVETGIDMLAAPSEGEFRSIACSTGGKPSRFGDSRGDGGSLLI